MDRAGENNLMKIGPHEIGEGRPVFIIAEIGVNHNGSVETAKRLINAAKEAGADAVKFQKRFLKAAYSRRVMDDPNAEGQSFQYLIPLLEEFELSESEYKELVECCREKNITFLCTPFDEPSVDFLREFNPPAYKVSSADLVNTVLIEKISAERKPLILSVGMASESEIAATINFLKSKNASFAMLHCQSTYPAPLNSLNLRFIPRLREMSGTPVGYSGHERGFLPTLIAVGLGASIVERHITLDKNAEGPDHAASLEPGEFKEMVSQIRNAEISMGSAKKIISRGEYTNIENLRKSLVAAEEITAGTVLSHKHITAKGPGTGLSPQRIYDLIGKKASRTFKNGDLFYESDLRTGDAALGSHRDFKGAWGVKSRFHEIEDIISHFPKIIFFEFHLSDKDLSFNFPLRKFSQSFYFHAPEYNYRSIVDLCSLDDRVWRSSIDIIQKTLDKARGLAASFSGRPAVILHVGGITSGEVDKSETARMKERLILAFSKLDKSGVDILPENMPPFGWFFGGERNINIFVRADDITGFCREFNLKMCFDFSHAWLACEHSGESYPDYIRKCAPFIRHLHVADGLGVREEGLQIGEGDIPFKDALKVLAESVSSPSDISWVPEIWHGHINKHEGTRIALGKISQFDFFNKN